MRFGRALVVLLLSATLLVGCSGSRWKSEGGSTTCGTYLSLDSSQQTEVIKDFFDEKGNSNPSNGEVMISRESAKLYCNTLGSDTDPISNIDG